MILKEAIDAAIKESRAQKSKFVYVVATADGECDISLKPKVGMTSHAFLDGKEVKFDTSIQSKVDAASNKVEIEGGRVKVTPAKGKSSGDVKPNTVMAKKVKKTAAPKGDTATRGNNMTLTKAQWAKVDARLKKDDLSFSAFSRGLVLKAIGE